MPNNIWNSVSIDAKTDETKKQLKGFIEKSLRKGCCSTEGCNNEAYKVDFNLLIPMPKELKEANAKPFLKTDELDEEALDRIKKYGYESWYSFGVHEWGTKWNAWDTDVIEINEEKLRMSFITAWATPIEWLLRISEEFPELTIYLDVNGETEERGELILKDGTVIEELWTAQQWWGTEDDNKLDMEEIEVQINNNEQEETT